MTETNTTLSASDLAVDRELAGLAESFRFLLDVTPVNVPDAKARFLNGDATEPDFAYRALDDRPDVLRARLECIDVHSVQDSALAHLLRAKHRELELQIDMLSTRGTRDFLALSLELYGGVAPPLLDEAEQLLRELPADERTSDVLLDANDFACRVETELDFYRAVDQDIRVHVELRDDTPGVMVANGDVLIGATTRVAAARVEALLQHEVGTHVVTHVNGSRQPLRLLAAGLAGYEETQEGLAVLAEHLAGALGATRLRELAARVVAVHRMITGDPFATVHAALTRAGLSPGTAFTTTMRAFRGGGFTKDAIYLRGLHELLVHIRSGGALDVLLLGKLPLTEAPLIEDLLARGVLTAPLLRPRYLTDATNDLLVQLRHTTHIIDLVRSSPS